MNKKIVVLLLVTVLIIGGYFGATFYLEAKARGEIDKMVKVSGTDLKYDNVSINLLASTLTINKVNMGGNSVSKLILNDIYSYDFNKKSIPDHLNVKFNGVSMNTDKLGGGFRKYMKELGYGGIVNMDFGVSYSYYKDKKAFLMEKISIDVDDMYKIDFRADLENIDLDLSNPGSLMQVLFKYPDYRISFSELLYSDDSFMKKTFESQAKNKNSTYEKEKEKIEKLLAYQIEKATDQSVKDFYKGAGKLMFEPGNYAIRISPDKPIAIKEIMRLRDPSSLIKALNLSIQ